MTAVAPDELRWNVHGLTLAGLGWGNPDDPPLLALHGWLDNAASFTPLSAHLDGFYLVAVDLTGHGRSDWRSPDATYQVYDDLPQLHGLVEQLGWDRFNLLGHSRGAIISALFAATFPERVSQLVLLDGLSPPPLAEGEFVQQMRSFVQEKSRLMSRRSRVYATEGDAVTVREEQGLTREAAQLIALRNLRACEGGYTWTTDPRLRGASAVKLTEGQIESVLARLTMPTLLLAAEHGLAAGHVDKFTSLSQGIPGGKLEAVGGGHHFHMEEGVAKLGDRIQRFLLEQD